jgi:phosphonate transport system permease protein
MATAESPLAKQRAGETPGLSRPLVKPPKPFFLRSWFGFVIVVALIAAHVYGWQKAEVDPALLARKAPDMQRIINQLLQPDIIAHDQYQLQLEAASVRGSTTSVQGSKPVEVSQDVQPIFKSGSNQGSAAPGVQTYKATLTISSDTVIPGQQISISGSGFRPNSTGEMVWRSAGSSSTVQKLGTFAADAQGNFKLNVTAPTDTDRVVNASGFPNTIIASQTWDAGNVYISATVPLVLDKILETIFLALMGTTFAVIVSIPISFLAARNLMAHNLVGNTIYGVARTALNVLRSIEVLIFVVIFAASVGIGPFAGVLALTLHSIASLGKLYSEAIESIDPGPIEAITATGANRLQVINYAVIPQFIPQFVSFTLYTWDRNVRMSTVIGLVGGGGIGYILIQYVNLLQWNQASTAIIAIALVVIAMDTASARIRSAVI